MLFPLGLKRKTPIQAEQEYTSLKSDKEKQLSDKENIITMLTDKLMAAEDKAKRYDDLEAKYLTLKMSLTDAEQTQGQRKRC